MDTDRGISFVFRQTNTPTKHTKLHLWLENENAENLMQLKTPKKAMTSCFMLIKIAEGRQTLPDVLQHKAGCGTLIAVDILYLEAEEKTQQAVLYHGTNTPRLPSSVL